jgi:uncharacterized membrane protein
MPSKVRPSHIEAIVQSVTKIDTAHDENATDAERWIDRVIRGFGRPRFLGGFTLLILAWIAINLVLPPLGIEPIDPPPFVWLVNFVTLSGFYVVFCIFISQRREQALAQHQAKLVLQLTLLSEQKTTKIIALLEELRRDSPLLHDRVDHEALAMTRNVDPDELVGVLKQSKPSSDEAASDTGGASRNGRGSRL